MVGILEEKLREFGPEADAFKKKSADMKILTEIEKKTKTNQPLAKPNLLFLYEINSSIEGFGYQRDPRIAELRQTRNFKEDASIVFECLQDQIAKNVNEANENTRVYIGEWSVEIFQKIRNYPNIKHLYESFPDKEILMQTLETNAAVNSPESAEEAMERKNIYLSDWGKDILYKTEFSKEFQKYDLVRFAVRQLGFHDRATTDEIYKKAEDLGLELCPAEVGPHLCLQYSGKEWMFIAMKQITDRDGHPHIFRLDTDGGQLELNGSYAGPNGRWSAGSEFVFCFRKLKT